MKNLKQSPWLFLLVMGLCLPHLVWAGEDDERSERRAEREKRDEMRVAMRRVQKCFATGEVDCFDKEDQATRTALLGVYMKFLAKNPKATQDFLKGK